MIEGWYISVAAVKEFMRLCRLPAQDEGPVFDGAAIELERACGEARLADEKMVGDSHRQVWRVNWMIRGKKRRLEITVATSARKEGDHPQVIWVVDRDARR